MVSTIARELWSWPRLERPWNRTMPVIALCVGGGSSEVTISPRREQKKNPFRWRFACILVAAWEGRLHTRNFMYSALRVDGLMYRAASAKEIPFRFFLKAKFASFRSTATTRCFSETESATGSFSR